MCCLTSDSPARLYNQRVTILALHHVQINVPASRAGEARRFFEELVGLQEMQRPESLSGAGRNGVWYRCGDNEFHVFFAPDSEVWPFDAPRAKEDAIPRPSSPE